ncbi:MAG: D-alanine--D-alanine ligase [Myxococcales bacterium]|nr:D-alanine--D-alanine ligase [Myxococcales bacterium]
MNIDKQSVGTAIPRVAVLMGGLDDEHDISLMSGNAVVEGLEKGGLKVTGIVIGRDGLWNYPEDQVRTLGRALDNLRRDYDAVFVALHGPTGEGGIIQAGLELVGIPYTGSDAAVSSVAMDKSLTRLVYQEAGLPVAKGVVIHADDPRPVRDVAAGLGEDLCFPVFSKPLRNGSSYGIRLEGTVDDAQKTLAAARRSGQSLLFEEQVEGEEFTVAILEDEEGPKPLPPILIKPKGDEEFFTLEIKYDAERVDEICPAPVSREKLARLTELGLRAHRTLGCRDFSRTDMIWGPDGPVLLETNTIPGLTPASLFPKGARAAGLSFSELVCLLAQRALARST